MAKTSFRAKCPNGISESRVPTIMRLLTVRCTHLSPAAGLPGLAIPLLHVASGVFAETIAISSASRAIGIGMTAIADLDI